MSGDWIAMRCNLATDPAVISIAAATKKSEDLVVGKLHRLWAWADQHALNGDANGVTLSWVNRHVGVRGFAEAMGDAGWLVKHEEGISFPNFNRFNSNSGKARLQTAKRMSSLRLRKSDAGGVTERAPTEQNRTEQGQHGQGQYSGTRTGSW